MIMLKVPVENQKQAMIFVLACGVRYFYNTADLTAIIGVFISDRFFKNIFVLHSAS